MFSLLRLNVEEFIRSLNYDVDDSDINAQSEVVRFLSLMAIEFAENTQNVLQPRARKCR